MVAEILRGWDRHLCHVRSASSLAGCGFHAGAAVRAACPIWAVASRAALSRNDRRKAASRIRTAIWNVRFTSTPAVRFASRSP